MAKLFFLCAAFLLAFLLVPSASARPGGRSCHDSFFFRDLSGSNLRTVTLISSNGDSTHSGPNLFSIAAAKIGRGSGRIFAWIDYRLSVNTVEVRISNLHRQKLENPNLSYNIDLPNVWKEDIMVDVSSFSEKLPQMQILHTFSTGDPHPMPQAGAHPRHGMWRGDLADGGQQHPGPEWRRDDSWPLSMNDVWRIALSLLLGAACGAAVAVAMTLAWALVRRMCLSSHEDSDVGLLYGYQELPSPKSTAKQGGNSYQEVATKETASKMENM